MGATACNWPSARAGQLSAVWIPDPDDEAIRDLSRAREDAVNSRVQARHQLKGFLLRHDIRYPGKTSWSLAYYRWLSTLNFDAGATQTALTEYWRRPPCIKPTHSQCYHTGERHDE